MKTLKPLVSLLAMLTVAFGLALSGCSQKSEEEKAAESAAEQMEDAAKKAEDEAAKLKEEAERQAGN